jgi:methyl-accepting chemotaxis protein
LDLVEEGTAGFEEVTQISKRITRQIETLGSDMQASTADLKQARDPTGKVEVSKAKRAINAAAASMSRFADDLDQEIGPFRKAYGRSIRAYGKAATLLGDFKGDVAGQLTEAHDATAELEESIGGGQNALRQFREIVGNQPRLTSRFNRARRRVLEVLDALDVEMTSARTSARETMELFQELIRRFAKDEAG